MSSCEFSGSSFSIHNSPLQRLYWDSSVGTLHPLLDPGFATRFPAHPRSQMEKQEAGERPGTVEPETEEERIAAAMGGDVGNDDMEMSEEERALARRNMENLAVCQVASLQHEQPVVTRSHMAAPVFIKQDGKDFVFGTVSTSQGSHTMCPLCKRDSETKELTPQVRAPPWC